MNVKLVYVSIIDEKISSFVQTFMQIFNFDFDCVTYEQLNRLYTIFVVEYDWYKATTANLGVNKHRYASSALINPNLQDSQLT